MAYTIHVPTRKLESIFGNGYPALPFSRARKCQFLRKIITQKTGIESFDCDIEIEGSSGLFGSYQYNIEISTRDRKGYDIALAVEAWARSHKRLLSRGQLPFYDLFPHRGPVDSYMITDLNVATVVNWLKENCSIRDYQIYSKFGQDVSLGFRDTEASTLFKMTFDIPTYEFQV